MPTLQEQHFGIVTDNNDPEKRGRLKVKCQSLVGANYELPDWAEPVAALVVSKGGFGALFLPVVGSTVELVVDAHDTQFDEMPNERFLQNPNIKWRPAGYSDKKGPAPLPAALQVNYPNRSGWVLPGGALLVIDSKSGEFIIQAANGAVIQFNADGSIHLGKGAFSELMVLGNALLTYLNAHTHSTGVGPSGPPIVQATTAILSQTGNKVT